MRNPDANSRVWATGDEVTKQLDREVRYHNSWTRAVSPMTQPRLVPFPNVPWMICACVPELAISTQCLGETIHGIVSFIGYFGGCRAVAARYGSYREVWVMLEDVNYVDLRPDWDLAAKKRRETYDWGEVSWESMNRDDEEWARTGICVGPRAYIIENSDVMQNHGYPPNSPEQHYLFFGHDTNIEVIARKWSWRIIEDGRTEPRSYLDVSKLTPPEAM